MGAFLVAAKYIPCLLILGLICCMYLSVLRGIGPLKEFPPQAFVIPGVALVIVILILLKMVVFCIVGFKLKRLQKAK